MHTKSGQNSPSINQQWQPSFFVTLLPLVFSLADVELDPRENNSESPDKKRQLAAGTIKKGRNNKAYIRKNSVPGAKKGATLVSSLVRNGCNLLILPRLIVKIQPGRNLPLTVAGLANEYLCGA